MATRTEKTSRSKHLKPYASKKPSTNKLAPPQTPDSALTRKCKTQRDLSILIAKRNYPNLTPLNDFEILALSCGTYEGTNADFRMAMDADLIRQARLYCPDDFDRGLEALMVGVRKILDAPVQCGGLKPEHYGATNDEDAADIRVRPIPGTEFSIRLFGDGMENMMMYGLDFVRTSTGKPVNSPFKFELYSVPNMKLQHSLAVGHFQQRLYPLENSFGVFGKSINPGEEKFVVNEGSACLLKRRGHRDIYFAIPIRPRPSPTVNSLPNTIMIDFE